MPKVKLIGPDGRFGQLGGSLVKVASAVLRFLHREDAGLIVYLVGAPVMRKINLAYRKKNEVTDVIAVESPQGFPATQAGFLGEVYLNPPAARKKGYDVRYALIHGILHLLGFNHLGKNDKMRMEKTEKEILTWLANRYWD